jgi:hypothetical protein
MLIVETIARIRREHFIKGKTIKEIARDLKVFFDQRISAGFFRRGPPDYAPLAASSAPTMVVPNTHRNGRRCSADRPTVLALDLAGQSRIAPFHQLGRPE